LSQQRGGVGSRFGSGETKLEVDRRRIMRRITKLESDLKDLSATRQLQRKSRSRSGLAAVTIVGYTNAGKSTLLNHLTHAGVLVEDRLFATLDPTTRRLSLPGGEPVLITDTVGFVRNLPHGLVEAFKSTLEVAGRGDYLVHVVDSTAPDPEGQIGAVHEVLGEIEASHIPELLVFNKSDAAPEVAAELVKRHEGSVAVSALTGEGIEEFLFALGDRLRSLNKVIELLIPYERGDLVHPDVYGCVNGYFYDFVRSTVVGGEPTAGQRELMEGSLALAQFVSRRLRPGVRCSDVHAESKRWAIERDIGRGERGGRQAELPFFGHGIGLGFEGPWLTPEHDEVLQPGMVVAVEICLTAEGIGAAHEDAVLVTDGEPEVLTAACKPRWWN